MRFRKRVKVFPGFYLNFSGSGISSTFGIRGASINFSKRGTYLNTSIPGTGLYNRQKIGEGGASFFSEDTVTLPDNDVEVNEPALLENEIKSADTDTLTSSSLVELKETLEEIYQDRIELAQEAEQTKQEIRTAKIKHTIACIFLIGFIIKSFKKNVTDKEEYLADLENQIKNSFVNIDVHFDKSFEEKYNDLLYAYENLLSTETIWDITSYSEQDMIAARSSAAGIVTRTPVQFKFDSINFIQSTYAAFHLENKNGGDLYIYPAFAVLTKNKIDFGLIDIRDLKIKLYEQRFLEEEAVPSDTQIIDTTWAKVNKNGTPDKRFKGNYEIPIVKYGKLEIRSSSGLNESYLFSSFEKSEDFVQKFVDYQRAL